MFRSKLLFSAVFSFVVIVSSCKVSSESIESKGEKASLPTSFFEVEKLYKYQAEINAYDRIITGIIFIKRTSETEYRLVFANESGFQLMALIFENGKMKSHEVFKKIDKKIILNTLEKGIGMLFYESLCENVYLANAEIKGFRCSEGKFTYRYLTHDNGSILRIEQLENSKLEKWIEFQEYEQGWPRNIRIQHEDIHLTYSLKALNNE